MIYEDSRNALYCDPNAFIQKFDVKDQCEPKKVVFSEPYESLPAFYIDNNFKKGNCDCVPKQKKDFDFNHTVYGKNHSCGCNQNNSKPDDKCNHDYNSKQNNFGFDIKSLLPLLSLFNKSGGADLGKVVGLLNQNSQNSNNSNPMNMISSLLSNGGLGNVLSLFQGGHKRKQVKPELKTTDFEIKNYTKVE